MIVYLPEDISFTIDLQTVNCLTSISLEDTIDLVSLSLDDISWSRRRGTLQSWTITLQGEGTQGYTLLRDKLRAKIAVAVDLRTNDNEIVQQGSAMIIDLSREVDVETEKFSATLLGIGVIDASVQRDFLLQEDGSYILQEDGGRIII